MARYKNIEKTKQNGVVYTPADLAKYVAIEMLRIQPLSDFAESVEIIDPAVGSGELLIALINEIQKIKPIIKIRAVGYEIDAEVATNTSYNLKKQYSTVDIEIKNENFLEAMETNSVGYYDYIIVNPPYIRTQILGSSKSMIISKKLNLTGRIDIYHAFLLYAKLILKSCGLAGFITSNKFMTNKAGCAVRNYMISNYSVHRIIDFGDTRLFSAAVLPCVIIFSNGITQDKKDVKFTSIYEDHKHNITSEVYESIFDIINTFNGCFSTTKGRKFKIQQGCLQSINKNSIWTISSLDGNDWLNKVNQNTWCHFSDIGKVRVGIKTTADDVFIHDDWTDEYSNIELLKPLITHRNSGQIIANDSKQWKVLYTHQVVNGKRVAYDIEQYPLTKKYLMNHYQQLSSRNYLIEAKRHWYEIWVPQNPDNWSHRKIVFRDISEKPEFWLDETGAIVNGDCYWIDIYPDVLDDILYLALAVANSSFIEKYYDMKFNNKLYSGKRRYQTQYIEQFPLPFYGTSLAKETVQLVKSIIYTKKELTEKDKLHLDSLVDRMFS